MWKCGAVAIFSSLTALACGDLTSAPTVPTPPATVPASIEVTPPPPPHALSGVVYEPGAGPLVGVTVSVRNQTPAVTDAAGRFSIVGDRDTLVTFSRDGFVTRSFRGSGLPGGVSNAEVPLQPLLRIPIPGSMHGRLFPDDPAYLTSTEEVFWYYTPGGYDYDCSPCRVFHLTPATVGRPVDVRVRWNAPAVLTVSLGGLYQGIGVQKTASPGQKELTVRTSSTVDTLLIGIASPGGRRQPIPGPIDLDIDVTLP